MSHILKPTKQRINKLKVYGFDCETVTDLNTFYMCSIIGDDEKKVYYDKNLFISDIKKGLYNGSLIFATNLSFDFFSIFFDNDDIKNISLNFRGNRLITAKFYICDGEIVRRQPKHIHKKCKVEFRDTLNIIPFSVEKLGKLIKIPKLDKPKCLSRLPENEQERIELETYNINDSIISHQGAKFMIKSFEELGGNASPTIASCAMSLFKNKFLKDIYKTHESPLLIEIFKSYYGGRTEAIARGKFEKFNYYDVNSLYPYCMKQTYPNPNYFRANYEDTTEYIKKYHGCAEILIDAPPMKYPILPFHTKDNKLIFPVGSIRGYYTNIEINYAIEKGYKLKKVYRNIYYLENCTPLKDYVDELYARRLQYKKDNNPMEVVSKLLLNSLYGKFGQKFLDRDNYVTYIDGLKNYKKIEQLRSGFYKVVEDCDPASFCIPIWAAMVTAYGRMIIHNLMSSHNAIYCDTDSIITKDNIDANLDLGGLKKEHEILNGIIVKPKFYGFQSTDFKNNIKIKGVTQHMVIDEFNSLLASEKSQVNYKKIVKLGEALRSKQNLKINQWLEVKKFLNLEDDKRAWNKKFNPYEFQESKPRMII